MSNLKNDPDLEEYFDDQEDLSTANCSDGYTESRFTPTNDLTSGSIPQHFRAMAVPMAIGMIFNTLYAVVDTFFAGLISTDSQAGLSIASQVFFFLVAVGFGLSSAMSALVGNAYGEGSPNKANRIAQKGIVLGVLLSVILTITGLILAPELIKLISTDGPYREQANQYLSLLLLGAVFFVLGFGVSGILQARGDTKSMQKAQIAAFFANLVLNPLFIFGIPGWVPGMGFNGLAVSTLVSQAGVMLYMLYRIYRARIFHYCEIKDLLLPDWRAYRAILAQLLPSSFSIMIMIFSGFIVQYFLKEFGPEAVAGFGIAMRLEQLVFLPVFGLTGSLMPIVAQNFGAKDYQRVRDATLLCLKFGIGMMIFSGACLWLLGPIAMSVFTQSPEVIEVGLSYLRVSGLVHWAYLIMMTVNSLLQAYKKPNWTMLIGFYRQVIGVALFSYLYLTLFDWGVWSIWIGIASSVVTGMLLSVFIAEVISKKMINGLFWPKT